MPQPRRTAPDLLALLRGVSRSFYVSIRLLPAALRKPIAVAYLLARAADTLADTAELPAADRLAHLDTLISAIDETGSLGDVHALSDSFAPLQHDAHERELIFALSHCLRWLSELDAPDRADVRTVLLHITRGQALDVERFHSPPVRTLQTRAELDGYTYLVAGSVGEFWTDIGFRHLPAFANLPQDEMRELARSYGMGLQLVNILRDAGSDLAAGRCYFPGDELLAAGIEPDDILREPGRFESVWNAWQVQAQRGLDSGMRYANAVHNRRVRAASALPALLGARTLALLRDAGPQRLQQRISMPRREVRSIMGRLAFTFAGRAPLHDLFSRLGWDNRPP